MADFDGDIGAWQRRIAECPEGLARRLAVQQALAPEPGKAYLDVGCGGGHLVKELSEAIGQKGRVVGLDPSPDQLSAARNLCADTPIAELVESDALHMDFPDGTFDGLSSIQTLEYIQDTERALAEMRRVVKDGATIALVSVLWDHWRFHGAEKELNDLILDAFRAHCFHQMLPLEFPHFLTAAGFDNVTSRSLGFFNDKLEETSFAYWGAKIAAFFAGTQGVPEDKTNDWLAQLEQANEEKRFGFVSVPILTTGVAS